MVQAAVRDERRRALEHWIRNTRLDLPSSTPFWEVPGRIVEAVWPAIELYIDELEQEIQQKSPGE